MLFQSISNIIKKAFGEVPVETPATSSPCPPHQVELELEPMDDNVEKINDQSNANSESESDHEEPSEELNEELFNEEINEELKVPDITSPDISTTIGSTKKRHSRTPMSSAKKIRKVLLPVSDESDSEDEDYDVHTSDETKPAVMAAWRLALTEGSKVDARCPVSFQWCRAKVVEDSGDNIEIKYEGWGSRYNVQTVRWNKSLAPYECKTAGIDE